MKTTGIITEYNPFHKGHIYHIQKSKEQGDLLIAIISSFFSQRGLFSLMTRQDKTRLALEHGVDLVIELPMCYACQSADYFARYAIQSLSCLGIDQICFGSETNDIHYLNSYIQELKNLSKDASLSLNQNINKALNPLQANDILGIQYIQECKKHKIKPICIQRSPDFLSATKTRSDFFEGKDTYNQEYFIKEQSWDSYYPYLRTYLQLTPESYLQTLFLVNEGIEYRLKENARKYDTWNSFLEASISKTYSRARIQRTCLFILMQITKDEMKEHDNFYGVKVLGFNKKGQALLKAHKDQAIYTRFQDLPTFLKQVELKSLALYNSVLSQPIQEKVVVIHDS